MQGTFTLISNTKEKKGAPMETIKNNPTMKTAKTYILWIIFAAWMLAILALVTILDKL